MKIVVNDTNIFIDLIHVNLIDLFFQLPFEVHTTDFVIEEIEDQEQNLIINQLISDSKLIIAKSSSDEIDKIRAIHESENRLSITDCSVWFYSKKNNYTLLTGDNLLRKTASKDEVIVRGILYIFDELVDHEIIIPHDAAIKLKMLMDHGSRLPKDACSERIKRWSSF